jgi:hypothetical protein
MGALKLIESIAQHFYTRFTPAGYGMGECRSTVRPKARTRW